MIVTLIGAGNLATQIASAIVDNGHQIKQIYSRSAFAARALAVKFGCPFTNQTEKIEAGADVYIYAVKDDVLKALIEALPDLGGIHVHTAGSMSMNLFQNLRKSYGVLYPMQTFSKSKSVKFDTIPVFVEGSDNDSLTILKNFAKSISRSVMECGGEQRQSLHLAAVFCCNFVNHLFCITNRLLKENNLPFEPMLPLIKETIDKIQTMSPLEAQTGPAIRKDENVMEKHLKQLSKMPYEQEVYKLLSEGICRMAAEESQKKNIH